MPDNCQLTLVSPITKVLTGPSGKDTTIKITNNSGGNAQFQSVTYDGNVVATAATSATFTIGTGDKKLSYVYEGSAAGDDIVITDPCGTQLDSFACDPGNFRIERTVIGTAAAAAGQGGGVPE